jgi:hypothetical protein
MKPARACCLITICLSTLVLAQSNPAQVSYPSDLPIAQLPYRGRPARLPRLGQACHLLGKVKLVGGVAEYSTSKLAKGKHTIKAVYSGSADYKRSFASLVQSVRN